jgi:hypothetical protein
MHERETLRIESPVELAIAESRIGACAMPPLPMS